MKLSRERILRSALAIVDREGLDAISMRRVGDALGVEAMSLYNHVANKAAILDGIFESILEELPPAPRSSSWRVTLRERAHSLRAVLAAHPNALPIIATRVAATRVSLGYLEGLLGLLRGAGFTMRDALYIVQILIAYVVGHAMASFIAPNDDSQPDYEALPAEQFPHIRELAASLPIDREREFEFGLGAILAGFAARLPRR